MSNAPTTEFHELCSDKGYFHLTPIGWVRCDQAPFPQDRVETWRYEMEQPESDAKENDRLTRVWFDTRVPMVSRERLRTLYGEAVAPRPDRRLTIQCEV
jgi:hypothetical protein